MVVELDALVDQNQVQEPANPKTLAKRVGVSHPLS